MQNLKIRVNSEAESREVQSILFSVGKTHDDGSKDHYQFCFGKYPHFINCEDEYISASRTGYLSYEEITLPELRAMVNPINEYLEPLPNGEYKYHSNVSLVGGEWIKIPEGAEAFGYTGIVHTFYKDDFRNFFNENTNGQWDERSETWIGRKDPVILWQREQDEPFLTPECTLNDQYAEIEQVRQAIKVKSGSDSNHELDAMSFGLMGVGAAQATKDNVNHPSHYTQGKVECIDALESATIGKSGIEAVCVANVIKYLWRYEEKNGVEDVKKAKFYLNRLLATLGN